MDSKKSEEKLVYFFSALCLFLSSIENAIPKPLPFLRLGLANFPIVLSLFLLPKGKILILVLFKIIAQGIISGTLFSYVFLFSAGSSFSSALSMILIYTLLKKYISPVGICLFGSFASTIAQLLISKFILFGNNTKYFAPVILLSGLITGLLLGLFSNSFINNSRWFKALSQNDFSCQRRTGK